MLQDRGACCPATEFVPGAFAPNEVLQEHMKDAERIAAQAADRSTRSGHTGRSQTPGGLSLG
jgi:hypothetical protein